MQATALEVFLTTKLKQYDTHAPDAASTSLALWLLEILLARCASEAVTPRSGQPPPPPQPTPRDAEPSQEVAAFIRRHQALLPWQAVEQVLRAGGRRSDLKAAARIYHVWPLVFSLSLPGSPPPPARSEQRHAQCDFGHAKPRRSTRLSDAAVAPDLPVLCIL